MFKDEAKIKNSPIKISSQKNYTLSHLKDDQINYVYINRTSIYYLKLLIGFDLIERSVVPSEFMDIFEDNERVAGTK